MPNVFLAACEKLAYLYQHRFLEETRRACPGYGTDPWDSLRFFLMSYAFERQGRANDYAPAAADVVAEMRGQPVTQESASQVWEMFRARLGDQGLNAANNPLCPCGFTYARRYKGKTRQARVSGISAVELVAGDVEGQCLVTWARDLVQAGEVAGVHGMLTKVNGVSNKITSFFLRDVASMFGITPEDRRTLLQPIDRWVRFVARALAGDDSLSDARCASFLVENSPAPERANQGIWYFCARIAESSQYRVSQSLDDRQAMDRAVKGHLHHLQRAGQAAGDFVQAWEEDQ